ncbi:MAG: hypothetical protein L6R36_007156 [Xanthoria steineri]|nr:MAG: hypothetical protein L6R36_007156 [Xanthoria steineri]
MQGSTRNYIPPTKEDLEWKKSTAKTKPSVHQAYHQNFNAYFTMIIDGKPHHMTLETGLPQLVSLIISRSMFPPISEDYKYLNTLIGDAVKSFTVEPHSESYPKTRMAPTDMAGGLARITAAYQRLSILGVQVGEMKVLTARLVGTARETPGAGHCLMKWSFQMPL